MPWASLGEEMWQDQTFSGGLQEVKLIGGDREGGGSVCVSLLLPSLHFTRCEDQCRRRRIVTHRINPIKAEITEFLFGEVNTPSRINKLQDLFPVQPISPIGNKCVMGHRK